MSWFLIIGFLLMVLFCLGIICTLVYCIALVKYLMNDEFYDDDWEL